MLDVDETLKILPYIDIYVKTRRIYFFVSHFYS